MAKGRQSMADAAAALARQLHLALLRERIVRRFADSYVLENERQALQAHAVMYRDLLALLDREALLALSVRALEIVCDEPRAQGRSKPRPMARREAALLDRKSTRLNSSHVAISYAVFCLKKKKKDII